MDKIDNITRLSLLRFDAEIRACRYQIMLKQQELNLALEHQERWKKEYQNVLAKFLARTGVNLTEYTFDDESGVLSRIKKE